MATACSPSTPASSCTTRAPTRCCSGCSPSSTSRPSRRRCRCRSATTAPASSGPGRSVAGACSRPAANLRNPRYLRMLTEIPRFHRRARPSCWRPGCGPHPARRSSTGPVLGVLRPPLHGAPGRRGLVVRPGGGAGLPGALPVHLPRAPRHARRLRQPAVAHRDGRLPGVRRQGGRARCQRGPHRHQGHLGPRDPDGRRGHRRQRSGDGVRRRRRRHPPGPGPGDARRADRDPARRAHRDAVLAQHRAAAHRHLGAAARRGAPGRRGTSPGRAGARERRRRHLRPHPAAAPRHRDPLPRDARRRGPRRPGDRDRPDGVRAPALQPRPRWRPRPGCPRSTPTGSAFAGAYHGWGFHEDGARSGLAAVERLGLTWPCERREPVGLPGGGVFATTIRHTRRKPFARTFTHRSQTWLVDVDDLPDHGLLGRFEARDHIGRPGTDAAREPPGVPGRSTASTYEVAGSLLAAQRAGLRLLLQPDQRLLVLGPGRRDSLPRSSRCTTPTATGTPTSSTPTAGPGTVDKAMYVSPFHGTDGTYRVAVAGPRDGRLHLAVTLGLRRRRHRFSASLTGSSVDSSSPIRAAPAAIRHSLLIRMHGIWLWLRRLPIQPRRP